jgi:DNA helicase-4
MPATRTTNLSSYKLSFWARWFASKSRFHSFKFIDDSLVFIDSGGQKQRIECLAVDTNITIKSGWFWDVLVVPLQKGEAVHFGGVKKAQSRQLQSALNSHVSNTIQRFYHQFEPALKNAAQDAKLLFTGRHYIRHAIAEQWLARHQYLSVGLQRNDCLRYLKPDVLQDYHQILPLLEHGQVQIAKLNNAFVEQQIRVFQTFFDQVESNPLTEQQRKACVIDEQHNLVLAGAGTGKTSTMIGRAGYLVNAGLAKQL